MKSFNEKGITLIEIIISLALTAFIAVAVASVVMSAYKARNINQQRLESLQIVKSIVDEITSERTIWKDEENLKSWLVDSSYNKQSNNMYKKVIYQDGIDYTVYVKILDTEFDDLFDVNVTVESKGVDSFGITRRLRRLENE